jgi:hypothetical protein
MKLDEEWELSVDHWKGTLPCHSTGPLIYGSWIANAGGCTREALLP